MPGVRVHDKAGNFQPSSLRLSEKMTNTEIFQVGDFQLMDS
jgi:hypothetical protein